MEEEVKPELIAAFRKAGLEITLRTLIGYVEEGFYPGPRRKMWWVYATVLSMLKNAYKLYERRAFIDEIS